ncbi:MAG: AAA family ATPase [Candidatus Anstonellales archaeon]
MIIKNEEVFSLNYIPKTLHGREKEISTISFAMNDFFKRGRGGIGIIEGPSGAGKTAVMRSLLEASNRAFSIVNCSFEYTPSAVITSISDQYKIVQARRGKAFDEQFSFFVSNVGVKKLMIAFDEADNLWARNKDAPLIIYNFARLHEIKPISSFIFLISNDKAFTARLSDKLRSMVSFSLEFEPYKPDVLRKIIKDRAMIGLRSYDESAVDKCVGYAAKTGDARMGISLLYRAAVIAENKGKERLDIESVDEAKEELKKSIDEKKLTGLTDIQLKIFEEIKRNEGITSGELYKAVGISERTMRENISVLEEKRLIRAEYKMGREGRTRCFYTF